MGTTKELEARINTIKEKNMSKSRPVIRHDDGRLRDHTGEGRGIRPMKPELKRVPFRTVMAPDVLDQVNRAAENEGISRSEWIERAVVAALAGGK